MKKILITLCFFAASNFLYAQWTTIGANIINTNTGYVTIGTVPSNPGTYKLYVQTGILTEKVKIALKTSVNWADYVFEPGYKLKSLPEIDAYIKTNKHLPGIPSADELVKNGGVDVNEMLAKQMEKIEELTLHLIEMNKKVEQLEETIETLQK